MRQYSRDTAGERRDKTGGVEGEKEKQKKAQASDIKSGCPLSLQRMDRIVL